MDRPWLAVTYSPGFSRVRHASRIEVTLAGIIEQRVVDVSEVRFNELAVALGDACPQTVELTPEQLAALRNAVHRIDFARLSKRLQRESVCDATRLGIEVSPNDAECVKVEGAILSYDSGYHDFRETFEPAQQLWEVLYAFLPVRFKDIA